MERGRTPTRSGASSRSTSTSTESTAAWSRQGGPSADDARRVDRDRGAQPDRAGSGVLHPAFGAGDVQPGRPPRSRDRSVRHGHSRRGARDREERRRRRRAREDSRPRQLDSAAGRRLSRGRQEGVAVIVALSGAVETAWWVSLAVGLVVALVVWFLLEWLRRTVSE